MLLERMVESDRIMFRVNGLMIKGKQVNRGYRIQNELGYRTVGDFVFIHL
jgi:hypothetical protein